MSALLQLACFQMLIYAGMWAAGWVILGEERKAVLHWLGFNLLLALGLGLVSLRPAGDPWFTVVLANLVLAGGFLLLYRGGALFLRLPVRDGELAAAMLGCIAFALWSGPSLVFPRMNGFTVDLQKDEQVSQRRIGRGNLPKKRVVRLCFRRKDESFGVPSPLPLLQFQAQFLLAIHRIPLDPQSIHQEELDGGTLALGWRLE